MSTSSLSLSAFTPDFLRSEIFSPNLNPQTRVKVLKNGRNFKNIPKTFASWNEAKGAHPLHKKIEFSTPAIEKKVFSGHSRRNFLSLTFQGLFLTSQLFLLPASEAAENDSLQRMFSKYIKKKKLDPLETYVPTVLLSKRQFNQINTLLQSNDKTSIEIARNLLRSGPASSLRSDMKAVAQYAAENGKGKEAYDDVEKTLSSLDFLDSFLLQQQRDSSGNVDFASTKLADALEYMDSLLSTVPTDVLEKSKAIASSYYSNDEEENEKDGKEKGLSEEEASKRKLKNDQSILERLI